MIISTNQNSNIDEIFFDYNDFSRKINTNSFIYDKNISYIDIKINGNPWHQDDIILEYVVIRLIQWLTENLSLIFHVYEVFYNKFVCRIIFKTSNIIQILRTIRMFEIYVNVNRIGKYFKYINRFLYSYDEIGNRIFIKYLPIEFKLSDFGEYVMFSPKFKYFRMDISIFKNKIIFKFPKSKDSIVYLNSLTKIYNYLNKIIKHMKISKYSDEYIERYEFSIKTKKIDLFRLMADYLQGNKNFQYPIYKLC